MNTPSIFENLAALVFYMFLNILFVVSLSEVFDLISGLQPFGGV